MAEAEAAADAEANEEVENLLESYFMQIDRTYNRLKSLQEFMACEPGSLPLYPGSTCKPQLSPLLCAGKFQKAVHASAGSTFCTG